MAYSFAPNDEPLYVSEGDYVQFKYVAPNAWDTTLNVSILIGDLPQTWLITTIPEDVAPDPYPFEDLKPAELDTLYTYGDGNRPSESIITVTGLTDTTIVPIFISSNLPIPQNEADKTQYYGFRIKVWDEDNLVYGAWGPWQTDSGQVKNLDQVQVRGRSKLLENQNTRIVVSIGSGVQNWDITTKAIPVNEPIPFPVFTDLDGVKLSTSIYSEVLQITGLLEPGTISVSNGEYAISNNANTVTDPNGYEVLDGATFTPNPDTISNGQYVQLKIQSSNLGLDDRSMVLQVAEGLGSTWTVTTKEAISETPNSFNFPPKNSVEFDTLVPSAARPAAGISGLGNDVEVPVTLVSTDAPDVKIKITDENGVDGSIGIFPATVRNGYQITLYHQTSNVPSEVLSTVIKVGDLQIPAWQTINTGPPDDTPDGLVGPANLNNQPPNTYVTSAPFSIPGINVPVTLTSSNVNSSISIDGDNPADFPNPRSRTFDPATDTSVQIIILTATNLGTTESTSFQAGTAIAGTNPFTWSATTYQNAPDLTEAGSWYSLKTDKFDGYSVGTVIPILKKNFLVGYGDLDGGLNDRYPGFVECDGRDMDPNIYRELYEAIGTQYGGSVNENTTVETVSQTRNGINYTSTISTLTYTGTFKLPDYRNRRLCGTGTVDSASGNAAFLTPSNGKSFTQAGAEGGFWYFDKVDPFGVEPYEQIQGPATADNADPGGGISSFNMWWSSKYTSDDGQSTDPTGGGDSNDGTNGFFGSGIGQWAYRGAGFNGWTAVGQQEVREEDMIYGVGSNGNGTGMKLKITYEATDGGGGTFNTRIRIDEILDPGSGYEVGDVLTSAWWNNIGSNRIIELNGVTPANDGQTGLVSDFYSLGTVRITGLETLTTNIIFTITGSVSATVGPLNSIVVIPPTHQHQFYAARTESDDGFPLIGFGNVNSGTGSSITRGTMMRTGKGTSDNGQEPADFSNGVIVVGAEPDGGGSSPNTPEAAWALVLADGAFIGGNNAFEQSLQTYLGDKWTDMATFISDYMSGGFTSTGGVLDFDDNIQELENETGQDMTNEGTGGDVIAFNVGINFYTWWITNTSGLNANRMQGNGMGAHGCVIDIIPGNFTIDSFLPTSSNVKTHRHLLTEDIVQNFNADFTGGNLNEEGTLNNGKGSGLGGSNVGTQIPIVFDQSQLFMDMTEGTFEFSRSFVKPVPNVTMRPQKQAPLINPFHKTKYIIKAY